jgi:hypothetical protein
MEDAARRTGQAPRLELMLGCSWIACSPTSRPRPERLARTALDPPGLTAGFGSRKGQGNAARPAVRAAAKTVS